MCEIWREGTSLLCVQISRKHDVYSTTQCHVYRDHLLSMSTVCTPLATSSHRCHSVYRWTHRYWPGVGEQNVIIISKCVVIKFLRKKPLYKYLVRGEANYSCLTFSSSCKRRSFRSRYLLDEPPILNKADRLERSTGAHSAIMCMWEEKVYVWLGECVTMAMMSGLSNLHILSTWSNRQMAGHHSERTLTFLGERRHRMVPLRCYQRCHK